MMRKVATLTFLVVSLAWATEPEETDVPARVSPPAPAFNVTVNCKTDLLPGQYSCQPPKIDPMTQQPINCHKELRLALDVRACVAVEGFYCKETQKNSVFYMDSECKWTNGYEFDTALLLSVFLGMFGADRFYLGYPAIGLLKFSTLGFFFIGHLLDIILIATQTLKPADGSDYVISYFGPNIDIISRDEYTVNRPQSDWYT